MNGTQTFIVECARINSVRVNGDEGEDANNTSSWINKTKGFLLKKGDQVSLQNAIINIRGANSNSIEYSGAEISPTNSLQDNFIYVEVGYFLGNNATNSVRLPVSYTTGNGDKEKLPTDNGKFTNAGATQTINNRLGEFTNTQIFMTDTTDNSKCKNVFEIYGMNPNFNIDGGKFAKIDIAYQGWARDPTTGILRVEYPKAKLMTQKIPLELSSGFLDPNSIADSLTIQLQNTEPITSSVDLVEPVANYYTALSGGITDTGHIPMSQYRYSGWAMKVIPANLQSVSYSGTNTHRIYGNLACDEPMRWLYGNHILSNITTFNGRGLGDGDDFDTRMAKADVENRNNFKYNYPIFQWSIFNGDDPNNLSSYSLYSPYKTTIGGDGDFDVIEITGFNSTNNMDEYNDFYVSIIPQTTATGLNVIRNNNNLYFTSQFMEALPNPLINSQLYTDQDDPSFTRMIVYNRINQYNGTWVGQGHQITREVAYNDFFTTYQFGTGGADNAYFTRNGQQPNAYITRSFATLDGVGGIIKKRLMFNFLERTIQKGVEYKLSFKTTGKTSGASTPIYPRNIGVADKIACGFQPSTAGLNSIGVDNTYSYQFTATDDYTINDILTFEYTNEIVETHFQIFVEDISFEILHTDIEVDYTLTDIFDESSVNTKFYKYQKQSSLSDLQCVLTSNSLPYQDNYNTGNTWTNTSGNGSDIDFVMISGDYGGAIGEYDFYWEATGTTTRIYARYGANGRQGTASYPFDAGAYTRTWSYDGTTFTQVAGGVTYTYSRNGSLDWVDVNYNRTYSYIGHGLVASKVGNNWVASNVLGGNDSNTTILLNNDDITYSYWIFKQPSSTTKWYAVRTTKFNGLTLSNGVVLGEEKSNISEIKNQYRSGTQFFNLVGQWYYSLGNFYDFSSGNDFTNVVPGGYSSLRFTLINGGANAGGNIGYYDGYWANPANLPQRVYFRYNPQGDITATSGTAYYPNDPVPYQRSWSFDITNRTNGTFTQTFTDGSTAEYTPSGALTITPQNVNNSMSSFIGQGLSILFAGLYEREYAYTLAYNGQTMYFEVGDHEGTSGNFYVSPAPFNVNYGTWSLDVSTGVLTTTKSVGSDDYTQTFSFSGATPLATTDIVLYPDKQITLGGISYIVPRDGDMFPSASFNDFGDTQTNLVISDEIFFGADNLGEQGPNVRNGNWYNSVGSTTILGQWTFSSNNGYKLEFKDLNGVIVETMTRDNITDPIIGYGWLLVKIPKKPNGDITSDSQAVITEQFYINSDSNDDAKLDGKSGLYDGNYTLNAQTATFTNLYNRDVLTDTARLVKHQAIITNIKYTEENVKIIENYFRKTETYEGTETDRTSIIRDIENYFCEFDIGRSDDSDVSHDETFTAGISNNTSNKTPIVAGYMRDTGIIGRDGGAGDLQDVGNTFPRNFTSKGIDQRVKCFTRFKDGFKNRLVARNQILQQDGTMDIATKTYVRDYGDNLYESVDGYAYAKANNVGVYPYLSDIGDNVEAVKNYCMVFEVYTDYTDGELFKIQNGTYFGFSPSLYDHNYIVPMNPDQSSINFDVYIPLKVTDTNVANGDFRYTGLMNDMTNYINIGSDNPSISFSNDLTKFQVSYFHTAVKFNLTSGASSNLGEEIAKLLDDNIIFRDRIPPLNNGYERRIIARQNNSAPLPAPDAPSYINFNVGVNDAQCGIYVLELSGLSNGVEQSITASNYDGCLLYKLGFSFYDWMPQRFSPKPFSNRFNDLNYNNTSLIYRSKGIAPFTTNSNINIGDTTGSNIAPVNNRYAVGSPTDPPNPNNIPNPNKGSPLYQLGFNNNVSVSLQTSSDFLNAKSIPVNISSAFYRVMTDLPCDTLEWNAMGSSLSCIGYALKNYSSSSFFFSYGMDFGATITRNCFITNIKTELRNDLGQLVKGIDGRSSVFYKIVRTIPLSNPEPDPQVEELKDIEEQLKELNKKTDTSNTIETIENNILEDIQEPDTPAEPLTADTEGFMEAFEKAVIQRVVNSVSVPVSMIRASMGGRGDNDGATRSNRDINKYVIKTMARAVSNFYIKNKYKLDALRRKLQTPEGIRELQRDPEFLRSIEGLKDFNVNAEGRVIYGADDDPESAYNEVGRFSLTRAGAEYIVDEINKQLVSGGKITEGSLSQYLSPLMSILLLETNDIKANYGRNIRSKMEKEVINEELLRDPLPEALKEEYDIDAVERIEGRTKQASSVNVAYAQLKKAVRDGDTTTANILRRALITRLRDMGIKLPADAFLKKVGRGTLTDEEKASRVATRAEGKAELKRIKEAREKIGGGDGSPRGFDPSESRFAEIETKESKETKE